MAEGGDSCTCNGAKKKSGVFRLFRFGKKKKKKTCTDPENCIKCIQKNINLNASQYTMDVYIEKERMMNAEARRKDPNYVQLPPKRMPMSIPEEASNDTTPIQSPLDSDRRLAAASCSRDTCIAAAAGVPDEALMQMPIKYHPPHCNCPACKKKRYDDSLLAMDAQVILQNSLLQNTLSDTAGLVCVIL